MKRSTIGCFGTPAIAALLLMQGLNLFAQGKLSVDKVYAAYLRNTGAISEKGQIKGYFFLYQSDKIDKHTNEYTVQLLDENLNKVKNIKFEDSKQLSLLESAYNGTSICFLFKNEDNHMLDLKIYDFDGKLKYTYSREFDKRTDDLMKQYAMVKTDEGMNKNVFDVGDQGYVSVLPLRDGKQRTYEVDFYSSQTKKQWTYEPTDDAEKYAFAEYMGCTDSLIILEVFKRPKALSTKVTSHLVGINFVTRRKQFELEQTDNEATKILPEYVAPIEGSKNLMLVGNFYDKDENVMKDYGKGIAIYEMTTSGKVVNKTFNTWTEDFSKYLATNSKGKIDQVGYLFIHKVIRTPDGKYFIVAEGYKREASAGGIALAALSGGRSYFAGVTKIEITDMVMMQFDTRFKVTGATIYDKRDYTAPLPYNSADLSSQHYLAKGLKYMGAFGYEFTTGDQDNSNFNVCYGDYERSSEYHGQTFNTIRYNGSKLSTDKIELKSNASMMRVLPAKAGSVMIIEYFKKDKRLDFRLEKLG
jgi:hypothetical protein